MRLLTFTQYQKHNTLFTPVKGSLAILRLQITLPKLNNDKIYLSDEVMILYGRNKVLTKPEQPIKMILSKGIYSIEQFNQVLAKNKEILTRQWKPPQIENYTLKIPELYMFTTSNLLFKALGINNPNFVTFARSSLFEGMYNTTLKPYKPLPKNIYFYCRQINDISNEIDGQPSTLLCSLNVNEQEKLTFSPNHLIFLPLKKETLSLEFVLLDDQKGEIIPESFYLQVYNKEDECIR